jgi:hypothetical protein
MERLFKIVRSSLRMGFSRRSRSLTWMRLKSSFDTTSVSRCAVIHFFNVDIPTPRSSATCLRVSPLVNAICIASLRNSSLLPCAMDRLLCCSKCYQRSGIKPRQVHLAAVSCARHEGPVWAIQSDATLPRPPDLSIGRRSSRLWL